MRQPDDCSSPPIIHIVLPRLLLSEHYFAELSEDQALVHGEPSSLIPGQEDKAIRVACGLIFLFSPALSFAQWT